MRPRSLVLLLGVLVVVGAAGYAVLSVNGFSTRTAPMRAERVVASLARRWATPRGGRRVQNPVLYSDPVFAEERGHFADHCASCHGNDGSGQTSIGQALYPRAPDMRLAGTQNLSDGELYWIIENGIRLSGMPAFGTGRGDDLDSWKLVHFIRRLSELTPEQLKEMERLNPKSPEELEEERADQKFLAGQDDEKEKQQ